MLDQFDYYWRVEPDVEFHCDIDYDPFLYMQDNNLKYGFTISLTEFRKTVPTLWKTTWQFIQKNPHLINPKNTMAWLTDFWGDYNLCHFWSNFEIADLRLWRSERYMKYFEHLDRAGGFFYERWGDAPVHSLAVTMFLQKSEVHWFHDIGYSHPGATNCPSDANARLRCTCDPEESLDVDGSTQCSRKWLQLPAL